ncbi:MAG: hypothetical protein ABIH23_16190 [bacterium]
MPRRALPESSGRDARIPTSDATLVPTDVTTSGRVARGAAHRASPYVLEVARDMVATGQAQIGKPVVIWMEPWQTAVRWQDERRYAILAYQGQEPVTQQMVDQLADAFTRLGGKKVVEFRQASPTTGFLFFGGAPPELKIASVQFHRIDDPNEASTLPQVHPWFKIR